MTCPLLGQSLGNVPVESVHGHRRLTAFLPRIFAAGVAGLGRRIEAHDACVGMSCANVVSHFTRTMWR